MARDVYSLRIFCGQVNASVGVVGPIVPDEFIYVLRDIDINGVSDVNGDVITVFNPLGGNLFIARCNTGVSNDNHQWRGRQVFSPGEPLQLRSFQGVWDVMMSGYQLTLP